MIDCPSDSLAALHNIPVGCVVFHGAGQKKQDLKHKYSKCFHIRHLSWPEFCSFKAVACILSIILKHMIEWERMMSLICSQSWTYLVTIYNENNLSEKSIGHKRAERKKKGLIYVLKVGHLYDCPCSANTLGLFWFLVLPSAERSRSKRCQQAPGYPAHQYLSRDENTALTSWGCGWTQLPLLCYQKSPLTATRLYQDTQI